MTENQISNRNNPKKKQLSAKIDETIFHEWTEFCQNHGLISSAHIQKALEKYMENLSDSLKKIGFP